MYARFLSLFLVGGLIFTANAQKSKLNAAWRGLTDYQATVKEKPEISYLTKAKEAIDQAAASEETKDKAKLHTYKAQIYYELFKFNLKTEEEKAAATTGDKKQKMEVAYSNVSTKEFFEAVKSVEYIKINVTDQSVIQEILPTALSMVDDMNNLAVGAYKSKKYDEAADYFESSFGLSGIINPGKKDTVSLFNASLSASKAKNYAKVVKINQRIIDEKMANAGTYQYLYNAKCATQDSAGAIVTLEEGRKLYPNDMTLLNLQTDYYLKSGKQQESLNNLLLALEKDPNNAVLHLIAANTLDNMANPKGPDGKDKDKPANYDELFTKAETHYKKTVELRPENKDYEYNALFNLGALHYNKGTFIYNKEMNDATIAKLAAKQKEIMARATDSYKAAIPYFEQALNIKPDDVSTLKSLQKLYLLTGDQVNAQSISDVLSGKKTSRSNIIKMTKKGGVFEIPVEINDMPFNVIFDTGASEVSISAAEAIVLMKQGKLTKADFKGTEEYVTASGDIVEGTKVVLRKLKIGTKVIRDIEAGVSHSLNAPLLLGQSALSRFGKIVVDNTNQTLILE